MPPHNCASSCAMKGDNMKDWNKYPLGTKVHAIGGGCWIKTERGYKWCTGSTFPTPGADWSRVELPEA